MPMHVAETWLLSANLVLATAEHAQTLAVWIAQKSRGHAGDAGRSQCSGVSMCQRVPHTWVIDAAIA